MDTDRITSWAREHKSATILVAISVLFIGALLLSFAVMITGGPQMSNNHGYSGGDRVESSGGQSLTFDTSLGSSDGAGKTSRDHDTSAGEFVEVQEARFDIKSDDATNDAGHIRSLTDAHNGHVEQSRKHESSMYRTVYMTVRVPDSDFEAFTDAIQSQYDVDSFNVNNYRVPIQHELDELTLLNRTLNDYEQMRERILDMNDSQEKIQLMMDLTEKELEVTEKQQHYQRQLEDKEKRGDESTIRIELRERKDVDIWPENLDNRFMNNIKQMINSITNIALGTATQAVVLFFQAIQALIFLAVILIPLGGAYKVGKWFYLNHWKD